MEIQKIVDEYIEKIKNGTIKGFNEIPEEIQMENEVVYAARKKELIRTTRCGYNFLNDSYFVEEERIKLFGQHFTGKEEKNLKFLEFGDFYDYLEGKIANGIFYQWNPSKSLLKKYNIDRRCLIKKVHHSARAKSALPREYSENIATYQLTEDRKASIRVNLEKVLNCNDENSFRETIDSLYLNGIAGQDLEFYIWNYITKTGEEGRDIVLSFISKNVGRKYSNIKNALGAIYGYDLIINSFKYEEDKRLSKSMVNTFNKAYRSQMEQMKQNRYEIKIIKYFDKRTHYFCIETQYLLRGSVDFSCYQYFDTCEEFIAFLKCDISDCDFRFYRQSINPSAYINYNEKTIFPVEDISNLFQTITSGYDRYKKVFVVNMEWLDSFENVVYKAEADFSYFFDYITYMDYDLSFSDLLFCDGLEKLNDVKNINFANAIIRSDVREKLGLEIDSNKFEVEIYEPESYVEVNENTSLKGVNDGTYELSLKKLDSGKCYANRIYYISDIHLLHKDVLKNARTEADYRYGVSIIVSEMLDSIDDATTQEILGKKFLLIGGDVASNKTVFKIFVEELASAKSKRNIYCTVIFVLGNHELWFMPQYSITEIVEQYRELLNRYDMYLLHNEILYLDSNGVHYICGNEIKLANRDYILNETRAAELIMFGGIGFAGCNENFNANNGIYRFTIDRKREIAESTSFNNLYEIFCQIYDGTERNIIVFTHMPIHDWNSEGFYRENYVYVSGHSHLQYFNDDSVTRVYADNQIGYYNNTVHLKYLLMDRRYNCLDGYPDGIHEITRDEYLNFYRGQNLTLTSFETKYEGLYLLKREGYYCFIIRNKQNRLLILNGGQKKKLEESNMLEYYYENMLSVIEYIDAPLKKYTYLQQLISDEIKKIGGNGRIHGAIIDVDGNNAGWEGMAHSHIYLHPQKLTITPYYAEDITEKYVYTSVPGLLMNECPCLYEKYKKNIEAKIDDENALVLKKVDEEVLCVPPKFEGGTKMYEASNVIRKMQKLESKVLTYWEEPQATSDNSIGIGR